MKKLHLDSEYRNRWEKFYLDDGIIEDSRLKNWRDVSWKKVIKISTHILGNVCEVDNSNKNFLAFMNFRWGGKEAMFDKGKFIGHKNIKIWTIGWTDGKNCFLKDVSFFTGELIKEYKEPLSVFINHLHPDIKV